MKLKQIHENTINLGGKKLTSLPPCPSHVDDFWCSNNKLTSLQGCPTVVDGDFWCSDNLLTSLQYAPTIVGGSFRCSKNKLTSLHLIHKQISSIGRGFYATSNEKLTKNLLGLILIHGLNNIELDNDHIQKILNKYLGSENKKLAMLQCQQELIEAGFEEAAQL